MLIAQRVYGMCAADIVPDTMSESVTLLRCLMEVEYTLPLNARGLTSCLDFEFAIALLAWMEPLLVIGRAREDEYSPILAFLQQVAVMLFMLHDTWIPRQAASEAALELREMLLRYVDGCVNMFKQWCGMTFEGKADPRAAKSRALEYCVTLGAAIVGMVLTCVKQGVFELAPNEDAVLRLLCLVSEGALAIMADSKAAGNPVVFDHGQPKWWDKLWPLFVHTMLENPCKFDFAVLGPAVEGTYALCIPTLTGASRQRSEWGFDGYIVILHSCLNTCRCVQSGWRFCILDFGAPHLCRGCRRHHHADASRPPALLGHSTAHPPVSRAQLIGDQRRYQDRS
jgi:hypothetical protein